MLRELNMLTVVLILYMGLFLESHVAVSDICSKCVCNLDVNCSSRGLSSIPKGLPINITSLNLEKNNITKLQEGTFADLKNLDSLDLSSNNIGKIPKEIFQNLTSLMYLDLSSNNIGKIPKEIFQNLTSLIYLDLNNNKIKTLQEVTFEKLSKLQTLDLRYNKIQTLQEGTFASLKDLESLDLKGNKLSSITTAMFRHMSSLTTLDLSDNNMMCGCHLPAVVNFMKKTYNRSVNVLGKCHKDLGNNQGRKISILDYSQCESRTNSFVFYLSYTKNPHTHRSNGKFNGYKISAENISRAVERELSTMIEKFRVKYCGLEENRKIFTINCVVLYHITKDEMWKYVYNTLNTSQTLRNLRIESRNLKLIDEMFCKEDTTSTENDTFNWPMTKVGTTVKIPCHANVATRRCSSRMVVHQEMLTNQNMTSPKCSPFTGIWREPDMSQCYNTEGITRELKNISKEIDKGNIEDFSKKVLNISQKSVYFTEEDIDLSVCIYEKMMPLISNVSVNITLDNVLLGINNIMNTPEKVLVKTEQSNRTASRMLDIIEAIPDKITLEDQQVTILYPNVGIGVSKVEAETFDGLFYGISYETNETEAKSVIYNYSFPNPQLEDTEMMDYISLPKGLLKHPKDEKRSAISRITFSLVTNMLYEVIQESNTGENKKLNSHIISANIPNIQMTNLSEPVNISLTLKRQNATNPQCTYWDESPGQNPHWSTYGCSTSDYVPGKKVLCSCNRLASFSVLMDVYQNEGSIENVHLLSIMSNIGCGISFVCLILTVMIHVCFKNLWKLIASKVLVNLCCSLAVTNLIFLISMRAFTMKIIIVCKTMAALLHYFLLTSLMWMTVEALHVCLALFLTLRTYQKSFMVRSSILAWGLPAVIVIITLAINSTNNYIRIGTGCWLSKIPFYAAFLSPVVIMLIFNLTIFSIAIQQLISMQNNKTFAHKTRKVRVFGVVGLFFLLGLPWIFAFFAFDAAAEAFKFLFVIFNTLQGMFIFIFYCIYKEDTRDVVSLRVSKRKKVNPRKSTEEKIISSSGNEREVKSKELTK